MPTARKNGMAMLALCAMVAFGAMWWRISAASPPWTDEPRHLLAAKNLALIRKPIFRDYSALYPKTLYYTRGMVITYPLAFLYKKGLDRLIWARAIPLTFILLTMLFWIVYLRRQGWLDGAGESWLVIFFLGQPMILEQATFLRFYAPLNFAFSVVLVCLWELKKAWDTRRGWAFIKLEAVCLLGLCIPYLDSWQMQYLPQFLLALAMLNENMWKRCVFFVRSPARTLLIFAAILLWLGPHLATLTEQCVKPISWLFKIRADRSEYDTYWDNIAGLIRFLSAVNVMLLGLGWISHKPGQKDFFRWIYLSGLLSGLLLAFFVPVRYIFLSRYFYLPIVAVTVGFAGMLAQSGLKSWVKGLLVAGYLVFSVLFTAANFYFERGNLPVAVQWLKEHMGSHDALLFYSPFYGLDEGQLSGKNIYLIKNDNIDKAVKFISAPGIDRIYFLTNDQYQFRDFLYKRTTGWDRLVIVNTIGRFLYYYPFSREVLIGLHGCDLKMFEQRQAVSALTRPIVQATYQQRQF